MCVCEAAGLSKEMLAYLRRCWLLWSGLKWIRVAGFWSLVPRVLAVTSISFFQCTCALPQLCTLWQTSGCVCHHSFFPIFVLSVTRRIWGEKLNVGTLIPVPWGQEGPQVTVKEGLVHHDPSRSCFLQLTHLASCRCTSLTNPRGSGTHTLSKKSWSEKGKPATAQKFLMISLISDFLLSKNA